MKKILFAILCVMTSLVSVAQNAATVADTAVITPPVMQVDTAGPIVLAAGEEFKPGETHLLRTDDDGEFVVYNGVAYKVGDVMDAVFSHDGRDYMDDDDDLFGKPSKMEAVIKIVSISVAFVVPCVTIILALVILMVFFMKKNAARNDIISKAIDKNYQLPDAFYTGYLSQNGTANDGGGVVYPSDDTGGKMFGMRVVPEASRDPKMFGSAMTLIAIGFAILLFFSFNREVGVGFLCGGIPLFLGVGRMIAYYYVPGAYKQRNVQKPQNYQGDGRFGGAPYNNMNMQQPRYGNYNPSDNRGAGSDPNNGRPQNFNGPCPPPLPSDQENVR